MSKPLIAPTKVTSQRKLGSRFLFSQECAKLCMVSLTLIVMTFGLLFTAPAHAEIIKSKSIAMHGAPKYAEDFTHLSYVNPDAPKGGTLRQSAIGTYDSLNPFIIKGSPAAGLSFLGQSYLYDSLMEQSNDEAFSMYGLLAETIEYDSEDKSWVAFNLNPAAKWHDGKPVTADDVVWSFNIFLEKGAPFFKAYYGDVTKVEATSPSRVRFTFKDANNAELPLILSQITILPKHYWEKEENDFTKTTLTPPLGSGAYKIEKIDAGRSITYKRVDDYWGKDLAINKGRFNFDALEFDYYKDGNVALEAFFAGEYDVRQENVAKLWNTSYDATPVKNGDIVKQEIKHQRPQGCKAFFTTRVNLCSKISPYVRHYLMRLILSGRTNNLPMVVINGPTVFLKTLNSPHLMTFQQDVCWKS